jgi:excisionase family DNA binding protein
MSAGLTLQKVAIMCAERLWSQKKKFLKISEVAEELGVSERSAWRLVEQGELASHGFGGSTRIKREDLDVYIQRSRRRAKPPSDSNEDDGPLDG